MCCYCKMAYHYQLRINGSMLAALGLIHRGGLETTRPLCMIAPMCAPTSMRVIHTAWLTSRTREKTSLPLAHIDLTTLGFTILTAMSGSGAVMSPLISMIKRTGLEQEIA